MIADVLLAKQYIGFDLDDTLHSYRDAARKASNAVFQYIAVLHASLTSVKQLSQAYKAILQKHTADAFKDGRTSSEYRKERFEALLKSQRLPYDSKQLQDLLNLYEDCLTHCLQRKRGAREVLQAAQGQGKRVILITEGPRDAQISTVHHLGLSQYIERIFTPGEFGKDKSDGLFQEVLNSLSIDARQLLFIGDNIDRDITPARAIGISTIHYNEASGKSLNECTIDSFETPSLLDIAYHLNYLPATIALPASPPGTPPR